MSSSKGRNPISSVKRHLYDTHCTRTLTLLVYLPWCTNGSPLYLQYNYGRKNKWQRRRGLLLGQQLRYQAAEVTVVIKCGSNYNDLTNISVTKMVAALKSILNHRMTLHFTVSLFATRVDLKGLYQEDI